MRLQSPVTNPREAFCIKGCYGSFYLHRCLVCEDPTGNRKICKKSKCRNALAAGLGFGRYHGTPTKPNRASQNLELTQEVPVNGSVFSGSKPPEWGQIVGPPLTPNQLHCATIAERPDSTWRGGEYERIEAKNRAMLKAHFAAKAKGCLIQPRHPPINILGRYKFPGAPAVDLSQPKKSAEIIHPHMTAEEIPAFLRRGAQ